ncbi:MAG TPA: hypothetical protein DCR97_05495 [Deltaproteobacteria bacterium]|nr:hypothetical protein [Deltaproteobacteria bacterium]
MAVPSTSLKMNPLGGCLTGKAPVEMDLTKGELIKREPVTLIWRNIPVNGRKAVVKMYRRGLFLQCYSLITSFRSKREFEGLRELEQHGVPCSTPLFWCHGHFGPYGWGEALVTEEVAHSQPLRDVLASRPEAATSLDVSPLFANLARMHAIGVHHGMLRTRNILVADRAGSPTFVFIDLARSHLFPGDIRHKRMALYDLMSLCEGLLPYFSEDLVHSWLSAYGIPEPERIRLSARIKRFRLTSRLRKALAWEFDIRNVLAHFRTPNHFWNLGKRQT